MNDVRTAVSCPTTLFSAAIIEGATYPRPPVSDGDVWGAVFQRFQDGGVPVYADYYREMEPIIRQYNLHDLLMMIVRDRFDIAGGVDGLPTPDLLISSHVIAPAAAFSAYRSDPRVPPLQAMRASALDLYINFIGPMPR